MSIGKTRYHQCSLFSLFNQTQPIKVASDFLKNTQNELYTPFHREDYDLERAVKILHVISREKRRYK